MYNEQELINKIVDLFEPSFKPFYDISIKENKDSHERCLRTGLLELSPSALASSIMSDSFSTLRDNSLPPEAF